MEKNHRVLCAAKLMQKGLSQINTVLEDISQVELTPGTFAELIITTTKKEVRIGVASKEKFLFEVEENKEDKWEIGATFSRLQRIMESVHEQPVSLNFGITDANELRISVTHLYV